MPTQIVYPETADIETSSDDYARRFSGSVGNWFLDVQKSGTFQMLSSFNRVKILDVGGGHGQIAGSLAEEGHQVTVFGSAEICKNRIQSLLEMGKIQFDVGNIIDLPYPDRSFDVVISYRLLPHVTQWKTLLKEFCRVANHAVIIDYPEIRSFNFIAPQLFRFKKQLEGNTRPFACFRETEITDVFQQHQFSLEDRFAEFFFPMVLHRKLNSVKLSSSMEKISRSFKLTSAFGSPVILKMVRDRGLR